MRCGLQSIFAYQCGDGSWAGTSCVGAVPDWDRACVLLTTGPVAVASPDTATLTLLYAQGAVDPSLWAPPCAGPDVRSLAVETEAQRARVLQVLHLLFTSAVGAPTGRAGSCWPFDLPRVRPSPDAAAHATPDRRPSGRDRGRFADGLGAPAGDAVGPLYGPHYRPDVGTLPFCAALPGNGLGLPFDAAGVAQMVADCVVKVRELGRQRVRLSPAHAAPLYVYTYELAGEGDQIYRAIGRAVRAHDEAALAFWRPLIWQVDQALLQLPVYRGRVYRGIGVKFCGPRYRRGECVCWPAFSSASATRAVAEAALPDNGGTLFIVGSQNARAVGRFSRCPGENEVLFRPGTVFQVTSALCTDADAWASHAGADSIAMVEVAAATRSKDVACAPAAPAGALIPSSLLPPAPVVKPDAAWLLMSLPRDLVEGVLAVLSGAPQFRVEALETVLDPQGRYVGRVAIAPPSSASAPTPADLSPPPARPVLPRRSPQLSRCWSPCVAADAVWPSTPGSPGSPLLYGGDEFGCDDPLSPTSRPPESVYFSCSDALSPKSGPSIFSPDDVLSPKSGPSIFSCSDALSPKSGPFDTDYFSCSDVLSPKSGPSVFSCSDALSPLSLPAPPDYTPNPSK